MHAYQGNPIGVTRTVNGCWMNVIGVYAGYRQMRDLRRPRCMGGSSYKQQVHHLE